MAGVGTLLAEARAVGLDVRAEMDHLKVRGLRRHEAVAPTLGPQVGCPGAPS